eukprot:15227172-Alexandrium_andersonii.AAC.1
MDGNRLLLFALEVLTYICRSGGRRPRGVTRTPSGPRPPPFPVHLGHGGGRELRGQLPVPALVAGPMQ